MVMSREVYQGARLVLWDRDEKGLWDAKDALEKRGVTVSHAEFLLFPPNGTCIYTYILQSSIYAIKNIQSSKIVYGLRFSSQLFRAGK